MASIDKIYGTDAEYREFKTWVWKNHPNKLRYFYPPVMAKSHDRPIANLPMWADVAIYNDPSCPQWVRERIEEQYGGPPPVIREGGGRPEWRITRSVTSRTYYQEES